MDAQVPNQEEVPVGQPDIVRSYGETVLGFLSSYGWFVTFGGVLIIILWSNLEPKFRKWKNKLENDRISAQVHKDPDSVLHQQEAMLAARKKLQEAHNLKSECHQEKVVEREEKKRQEKIADWDRHQQGKGYRSKVSNNTNETVDKNSTKPKKGRLLQSDYNPLMGGSGSSGFRPSRRSGGAAGG